MLELETKGNPRMGSAHPLCVCIYPLWGFDPHNFQTLNTHTQTLKLFSSSLHSTTTSLS
ncbi:hypothetical protein Hanom_Chr04g00338901 [Helianthus anomalus]